MALIKKRYWYLFLLLIGGIGVMVTAPFFGPQFLTWDHIMHSTLYQTIFMSIRIPRVLLGFVAGSTLAVCGMAFQAIFRNPLATPFTLGIDSGASVGVVAAIAFHFQGNLFGMVPWSIIASFCGAMCAMIFVISITSVLRRQSNITIILAGLAVSYMCSSTQLLIQLVSSMHDSFQIVRMLMGGLDIYGYKSLVIMALFAYAGVGVIFFKYKELDHFLTGEDIASVRGVEIRKTKRVLFFATALSVGAIVSVCGPVGFVGLVTPYLCRFIFGPRHILLAPATWFSGGLFLVLCDIVSRTIIAPQELPVGIITSLIGGPFFIAILLQRKSHANIWL